MAIDGRSPPANSSRNPLPNPRAEPGGHHGAATAPGRSILAALSDLQRHLDLLGHDLLAADRALVAWQGLSRDRFRTELARDLQTLARVVDDLRRSEVDLHDLLIEVAVPGGAVDRG